MPRSCSSRAWKRLIAHVGELLSRTFVLIWVWWLVPVPISWHRWLYWLIGVISTFCLLVSGSIGVVACSHHCNLCSFVLLLLFSFSARSCWCFQCWSCCSCLHWLLTTIVDCCYCCSCGCCSFCLLRLSSAELSNILCNRDCFVMELYCISVFVCCNVWSPVARTSRPKTKKTTTTKTTNKEYFLWVHATGVEISSPSKQR